MEYNSSSGSARMAGAAQQVGEFPVATYGLVVLNIVLFLASQLGDRYTLASSFGIIPANPQITSIFSSTFLHLDQAHVLINVAFLWIFGRKVERAIGPVEFFLFYVGAGFVGSLLYVAIVWAFLAGTKLMTTPVLGASGAISGVLGVYAVRFRREKLCVGRFAVPAVLLLMGWLLFQVLLGAVQISYAMDEFSRSYFGPFDLSYVSYWSHIGGFVFGMSAAWVTARRRTEAKQRSEDKQVSDVRRKTLLDVVNRYEALSTVDPEDPFAYAELGRVWALLGNEPNSTANYLKSIELYRKAGRQDEAIASLHEALRFWPEATLAPDIVFRFACYFETLGEYEEASNRFARLAKAAQGQVEGEMALLKLGQVQLDRLNHPERAIEALDRLLAEYPNSHWADLAKQLLSRAVSDVTD